MHYQWLRIDADREVLDDIADRIESNGLGEVKFGKGFLKWFVVDGVKDEIRSEVIKEVIKPFKEGIQELLVERKDDNGDVRYKSVPLDGSLKQSVEMIDDILRKNEAKRPMNDLEKNMNILKDVFFKK